MGNINQLSQIGNYYSEYFEIINRYQDKTRHSNFCLYLNINRDSSVYLNSMSSNYSKYENGVVFDSYDFTPLQSVEQLTNNSTSDTSTTGLKFTGESRVITYTIKTPQVGDLIVFPYKPNNKEEIFRVKEISTALNARNNEQNYFFSLSIEYAPIKKIDDLKIVNSYVYLLNEPCHLNKKDYYGFLKGLSDLNDYLKVNPFNESLELYVSLNIEGDEVADLHENRMLYDFFKKYRPYFALNIRIPFGIMDYPTHSNRVFNISKGIIIEETLEESKIINFINSIYSYEQRKT